MKERKYIDRLYQEKFRDFEATPRDAVWKNIEAKLQEKQKRKPAIPLWYRYAGVAAFLAFLLMLGDWILPIQPTSGIANEETRETSRPNISPVNPTLDFDTSEENTVIAETNPVIKDNAEQKQLAQSNPVKVATESTVEDKTPEEIASKLGSKNAILETSVPVAESSLKKERKEIPEELKPSIFDAVKDSEETKIASTGNPRKFEVSTHATPIYYGNFGKNNPLDVGFNDHRSSKVTMSYGVSLALNISDKVKLRSGVNRVDLSYSSTGLGYQSTTGAYPVRNASLVKIKTPDLKMVNGNFNGRTQNSTNRTPAGIFTQGNLDQKMGYVEVPLEFEVNLLERKIALNLIGGGSTLFLEENEVTLKTGNSLAAGKAENLNDISFSANLGLGVDYNLSEKFKLNLEPMLKYQFRTFDAPTKDVQPYFFGVYTGFSYKF